MKILDNNFAYNGNSSCIFFDSNFAQKGNIEISNNNFTKNKADKGAVI